MTLAHLSDEALLEAFRSARETITPETFEAASDLAGEIARRDGLRRDAAHAAHHGRPSIRTGRVEARGGQYARVGRTVCLDCYSARRPWDGRYDGLRP